MMSYKVETIKEQNARKAMMKQAIELGVRKERRHIDGFRITLIHDNFEIETCCG